MYRSCGSTSIGSPWIRARGASWGCASIISWSGISRSGVTYSHRLAHIAHGLGGQFARLFAAVGDDVAHQRRVVQIQLRALAHRALFFNHCVDHRLFAFDATDAGTLATLHDPLLGLLVGIHLVQRPHRALVGIADIGAADTRRVGRHGAYLLAHAGFILAQADGVVVGLGHLLPVQSGHL